LPFSSHIAAYIINKKLQKPWIMDIGDPFYLKTSAPENNRFPVRLASTNIMKINFID
jgi:hypothetical protein